MKEKILDKLKKLIAHSKSAEEIGSAHEAEAFAARIQQMLDEYNLSMDDVELHAARTSPNGFVNVYGDPRTFENWQIVLLNTVCAINGCTAMSSVPVGQCGHWAIAGRKTDATIAVNFFRYFNELCLKMGEEYAESLASPTIREQFFGYGYATFTASFYSSPDLRKQSYMIGIAQAICQKLQEVYNADKENTTNPEALVYLENRAAESEKFIRENVGTVKQEEVPPVTVDRDSFLAGQRAGSEIALTEKILG
jgi:hypothetical protein